MSNDRINFLSSTLYSRSVAAFIECQSMIAANMERESRGESLAYGEDSFLRLKDDLMVDLDNAQIQLHNLY